jgi:hypothetical protein
MYSGFSLAQRTLGYLCCSTPDERKRLSVLPAAVDPYSVGTVSQVKTQNIMLSQAVYRNFRINDAEVFML